MENRGMTKLGALLLKAGALDEEGLKAALSVQKKNDIRLGQAVVSLGLVTEEEFAQALGRQLNAPVVDLKSVPTSSPDLLLDIPESLARKHLLLPLARVNGTVMVAMADPLNLLAVDEIAVRLKSRVKTVIATERMILDAITKSYHPENKPEPALTKPDMDVRGEAPVARMAETLILNAVAQRASDIHLEPGKNLLAVRLRIDGVMSSHAPVARGREGAIVSRIKIMAGLDIAQSRLPQDGRFSFDAAGREVWLRVSTFPTTFGESVVIRIMTPGVKPLKLDETGIEGVTLDRFAGAISSSGGIVIITGPTGCGKTTTLYAAVDAITSPEKTVVTIEDPVERQLTGVRQTQINRKTGLTFAHGLKHILRQDPDIIMVGEIRDSETAQTAVAAAMTGHLVLTSMHTTNAAGAIARLIDLGVAPYQIASTVNGVLAQRLARRVCPSCKIISDPNDPRQNTGCSACGGAGYRGRIGLFEFLLCDDSMRELIVSRKPSSAINEFALNCQKMISMREDGEIKAEQGVTDMVEVNRVTIGQRTGL